MAGQEIKIAVADGELSAYLATPASGSGPGVVVIQEIFGVNTWMRNITDDLAAAGYVALCPDLFWRIEPGVQINSEDEEAFQKAFGLYGKFDADKGVDDLQATVSHLRGLDACSGKVGTVGFCLGGFLAYLMSARSDADASVGYYGVGIESKLGEASSISSPLMLHVAVEDQFVPKDAQAHVADALKGNAHVTLHDYAGADHAFARKGGHSYVAEAADLANNRTIEFFKTNLAA